MHAVQALVYAVMSTPPGKQQQRQHVGGASGRGQSTTPSHGTGRGGVQQSPRGRRGRRSRKNITPPRLSRKLVPVVSPASDTVVNEESSLQARVVSSSAKGERSSEPTPSTTSSVGTNSLRTDTSEVPKEGLQVESSAAVDLQRAGQQLSAACSLPPSGCSPSLDTVLPTATAEPLPPPCMKEKEDEGRSAGLSDVKAEDYGVARRLLNFTRGSGEREAEHEGEGRGGEGG